MNKKVAFLLIVLFIGANVWAVDTETAMVGVDMLGAGSLVLALPFVLGYAGDVPGIVQISVGGLCALGGIIAIIWGLTAEDPNYAYLNDNPLLKHVSFGVDTEKAYIGACFSF